MKFRGYRWLADPVTAAELAEAYRANALIDAHRDDPSLAFALARLNNDDHSPTPFGVFRDVDRPEYASAIGHQLAQAAEKKGPGDLATLLRSNGTWHVHGSN